MEAETKVEIGSQKMRINMALLRLASAMPELRTCQLIYNAMYSLDPAALLDNKDMFYVEDRILAEALEAYERKSAR